jgi:hypothetical protein
VISVINPKRPAPTGYSSTEEPAKYPGQMLKEFNETKNFVSQNKLFTELVNWNPDVNLESI